MKNKFFSFHQLLFIVSFSLIFLSKKTIEVTPLFPKINGVIELTDETIEEALNTLDKLLITFNSIQDIDHFPKSRVLERLVKSREIKRNDINIATFNLANNPKYKKILNIEKREDTLLFIKGKLIDSYSMNFNHRTLRKWLLKNIGNSKDNIYVTIKSIEQIKKFEYSRKKYDNHRAKLIYFGNNKDDIQIYKDFIKDDYEHTFGICENEGLLNKYNNILGQQEEKIPYNSLVIFNKHIHCSLKAGNITIDNIKNMIDDCKVYPYYDLKGLFNDKNNQHSMFIFRKNDMKNKEKFDKEIGDLSWKYKPKGIHFTLNDYSRKGIKKILDNLKIDKDQKKIEKPSIVIYDSRIRSVINFYEHYDEYTKENLDEFLYRFNIGAYRVRGRSQEIIKDNNGPIFEIVNDNFAKEVLLNDLDVVVKFYSPRCGRCISMKKEYDDLAEMYSKYKGKIRIAMLDMSQNYFNLVEIKGYPKVILWRAGMKDQPLYFPEIYRKKTMDKFIREHTTKDLTE